MRTGKNRKLQRGFTLLELMVVMAIILILLGMAAVKYQRSVLTAREAVLKTNLRAINDAIEHYTMDKLAAPQSLNDLLKDYLHGNELPIDPITQKADWVPEMDDVYISPDQTSNGITGVHSASQAISPTTNTPYSSW
ncbi:MAG: type II secretion system protein [Candidatus Acidiferrales bacterium]